MSESDIEQFLNLDVPYEVTGFNYIINWIFGILIIVLMIVSVVIYLFMFSGESKVPRTPIEKIIRTNETQEYDNRTQELNKVLARGSVSTNSTPKVPLQSVTAQQNVTQDVPQNASQNAPQNVYRSAAPQPVSLQNAPPQSVPLQNGTVESVSS